MALHYPPIALVGVDDFLVLVSDGDELEVACRDALVHFAQPQPTSLLDYVLLWLIYPSCTRPSSETPNEHVFTVCQTFDVYLQSVLMLSDLLRRQPELFDLSERVTEKLKLSPITEVFTPLDAVEQTGQDGIYVQVRDDWGMRYGRMLDVQYDHPALRRETYEFWKHRWIRSRTSA